MFMKKNNPNKELWHCRFGHLGMDNISKLLNENMVEGMSNCKEPLICLMCVKHVFRESNTVRHILRRVPIKQLNCSKQFIVMYVAQ